MHINAMAFSVTLWLIIQTRTMTRLISFILTLSLFLPTLDIGSNSNYLTGIINYKKNSEYKLSKYEKEDPQPKGGMSGLYEFLEKKKKYPKDAKRNGIEGKVYVEFIVDEQGNIPPEEINILKGIYPSLDEEASRLISIMPKWKPGKDENGNPVRVKMIIPIQFKL
jgi:TonB family protein